MIDFLELLHSKPNLLYSAISHDYVSFTTILAPLLKGLEFASNSDPKSR